MNRSRFVASGTTGGNEAGQGRGKGDRQKRFHQNLQDQVNLGVTSLSKG
jgi:hypothetical protein